MSTKVKGDKIKEGSIPLSALKPNRYNLSNNEDINEVKKAISEFKVGFAIIQNSFYSNVYITNISKVGGSVYNIVGIHEGMTFKVTIDINKISNPLFTDDNKIDASGPTPDWNAQEGEPGFIENKPDIDPVVCKYLCNPLNVLEGDTIPQDLHNIIYDSNTDTLKPIIINVMMLDDSAIFNIDSTQPWCYAGPYTVRDPYIYFPDERKFIIQSNM